jgi:hypothetical protein
LVAAARLKKQEAQRRHATRDHRKRVAKYIGLDVGIFKHLLLTVTDLSCKHEKINCNLSFFITKPSASLSVDLNSFILVTIRT